MTLTITAPTITVEQEPAQALRDAIMKPLVAFNDGKIGKRKVTHFALFVRHPDTNEILGGLWARSGYDWCYVDAFVVPEAYRGQGLGASLLAQAEAIARDQGCIGIWLDTFSFQARGFYEKQGFAVFGEIANYPGAEKRFFLQKRF